MKVNIHNLSRTSHASQVKSRYQQKAHQLFRRAREWQFGVFPLGKHTKRFVIQDRLKVLCRALVSFDPSGTGTAIFPSVKSIVRKVNELEAQRAVENGTKAPAWDIRKVYRYLRVLEDSAVMTCSGSAHNRKPRHRILHPDKLLKLPANRAKTLNRRRESVTREPLNLSPVEQPNLSPKNTWGEFHTSAPPAGLGAEFGSSAVAHAESSSEVSPATAKPDDDFSRPSAKIRTEPRERYAAHLEDLVQIVLAKWKAKLTGLEYVMAEIAVERIIERSRRAIVSANYLDRAIENFFLDDEERNDVMDAANRRICLRDKWMGDLNEAAFPNEPDPLLTDLFTPADIEHRENVNLAIFESQRTGHSADWILHAIRISDTAELIGDDDGFVHIPQVMDQGKRERSRERESFSERGQRRSMEAIRKAADTCGIARHFGPTQGKTSNPEPRKYCYSCGSTSSTCGCTKAEA